MPVFSGTRLWLNGSVSPSPKSCRTAERGPSVMHQERLIQTIERTVPTFVRRRFAGSRSIPDCPELFDLPKLPAGKLR